MWIKADAGYHRLYVMRAGNGDEVAHTLPHHHTSRPQAAIRTQ